ncbi:cytochrome bc1 complex Rieske iron-sulfur subunit [Motilibacter deserti]|nr:Rieske 2Fe-2S domain-containing protein [Motilibacter deserti]
MSTNDEAPGPSEHVMGGSIPGRHAAPQTNTAPGEGTSPHAPGEGGSLPVAPGPHGSAERFSDPGLPAHVHRSTDTDPKAAKRAERQITLMFLLSLVGVLLFIFGYFAFGLPSGDNYRWSTIVLGLGMFLALFPIGAGMIQWAKALMPDEEMVEKRKPIRSTDEDREETARIFQTAGEETGFGRRKMLWGSMVAAMGGSSLLAILPLKDLWLRNRSTDPWVQLSHTAWHEGARLVRDPTGEPLRPEEIPIGGVVHVLPEAPQRSESSEDVEEVADTEHEGLSLNDKAKAAVIVMRLAPEDVEYDESRVGKDYQGIYAYSKICTHVGCPVGLYEQQTHHLLCPCHQSTFDASRHCAVIFGPAARPLPQLAITVDADGYLVAQGDFEEPVGPSFWERG